MKLLVGNTSQISNYFHNDYQKISSRDISSEIFNNFYDEVHLTFGVNKKGLHKSVYDEINFYYTFDLIKEFLKKTDKIIIYSTCELWSACNGKISLKREKNFHNEPYILSKDRLDEKIKSIGNKKIISIYPFNFNSSFRSEEFLFGKIFKSIIEKKKIEIGNTYFYRDLLHASYVANVCQNIKTDKIIGSGRMFFINDFIRDLYSHYNLNYNEFVTETNKYVYTPINEYYLDGTYYRYNDLFQDTINDINKSINE